MLYIFWRHWMAPVKSIHTHLLFDTDLMCCELNHWIVLPWSLSSLAALVTKRSQNQTHTVPISRLDRPSHTFKGTKYVFIVLRLNFITIPTYAGAGDKELMVFIDSMYCVAYIRKSRQQYQCNLGFGWSEEQSKASGMIFNFSPSSFEISLSYIALMQSSQTSPAALTVLNVTIS